MIERDAAGRVYFACVPREEKGRRRGGGGEESAPSEEGMTSRLPGSWSEPEVAAPPYRF